MRTIADQLMKGWLARLNADEELEDLLGGTGRIVVASASQAVTIPSVEWMLYGDTEGESFNRVFVRLDLFIKGAVLCGDVEARIRAISHRDTSQMIGTIRGWIRYLDKRDMDFPSQPGVVHRALDFSLEAVRTKYQNHTA